LLSAKGEAHAVCNFSRVVIFTTTLSISLKCRSMKITGILVSAGCPSKIQKRLSQHFDYKHKRLYANEKS
jgi:hypothetical protein